MDNWLVQVLVMAVLGLGVSFVFGSLFENLTSVATLARLAEVSIIRRLTVVGVLLAAGPHVLIREALRAHVMRQWPEAHVAAAILLSAIWGVVLGFAVFQLLGPDTTDASQNAEDIIHLLKR